MKISSAHYAQMKKAYRLDVAKFIAKAARERQLITYKDLEQEFGILARAWGDPLGGIAIRCHEAKLPLLPVIVVLSGKDLPSAGAVLYEDLGLGDEGSVREMQERCFDFDWSATILGRD